MRISGILVATLFWCIAPDGLAQSEKKLLKWEREVELQTDLGKIAGTLLVPKSRKPVPVVIIISGSGPTDRNGNSGYLKNYSLQKLAHGLARNDIASVRYDKRGLAGSKSAGHDQDNLTIDRFIDDAAMWIDTLQGMERFSEVWVAGHSEGSLIGMMAIKQSKAAGFISIAGVGRSADVLLHEQITANSELLAVEADQLMGKIKAGDAIPKDSINPILMNLFHPSMHRYLRSWFALKPQKEIASLEIPVLIIQGTTDIQVKVSDAKALHAAATKSEMLLIEGMNHILKDAPAERQANLNTYGNSKLPLSEALIPGIVAFIRDY